jgi:hypothetical protein
MARARISEFDSCWSFLSLGAHETAVRGSLAAVRYLQRGSVHAGSRSDRLSMSSVTDELNARMQPRLPHETTAMLHVLDCNRLTIPTSSAPPMKGATIFKQ